MSAAGSSSVVLVALAASLASAAASLWAAAATGSSALLAIAILSLVAAASLALMRIGLRRAHPAADTTHTPHPAADLYVWSFVAALLLFSLGAGIAIYAGIEKLLAPPRILTEPGIAFATLALVLALTAAATTAAIRELNRRRGTEPALAALRGSGDPTLLTVLVESFAALAAIAIAALGIALWSTTGTPSADGHAAILIGLVLGTVATVMSVEIRKLLLSRPALTGGRTAPAKPALTVSPAPSPAKPIQQSTAPQPARPPAAAAAAAQELPPPRLSRKERKRLKHKKREA